MKQRQVDPSKSLEQLDGDDWGKPTYESHLVVTCYKLRKIPLSQFEPENFRILLSQNFSLEYLIPLVLDLLESDPWIECDFFPGDLLKAVLEVEEKHWHENSRQRERLTRIAKKARETEGADWSEIEQAFTKFAES